ncbi:hypothetical protein PAPYR_8312 [Paratrimastix pyriformis]|uniref:Uncharacterized protein n=1 Tax=Paratrimastix pyriformis TaxID=342808 RepID=A0ABQ8UGN6_9EUKA|nr:hypothetical protein PAPYR_8312 [Paratrimastix pyriformis]
MNPARGEDWLSRFERGIFGIFYLLRVDSPFPRTKTILWVISALQLFFLTVTVPSAFAQTPWFSIPRSILDFTFASTQTAMYVSFGVCSFFLVAFSVSAVLLGVFFQVRPIFAIHRCIIPRSSAERGFRDSVASPHFASILVSLQWFVPILGALMDILDCQYGADGLVVHDLFPEVACWGMHAVPSAVAILMLVLFVLVAAGCCLFTFSRHGFDEHSRGRHDLLVGLCKGLLVVAMRVLTAHTELRSITALGATAVMVGSVLIGLPYRGLFATVLSVGMSCVNFPSIPLSWLTTTFFLLPPVMQSVGMYWVSFLGALESALLWFVLPQYVGSWVPFVGLLGVAALTTPLVAWLTAIRYRRAVALTPAHVRQLAASPTLGATSAAMGSFGAAVGLALNPAGVGLGPDAMQPAGSEGGPQPVAPVTPLATSLLYLQLAGVAAPEQLVARCRWAPAVEWATRFLN